jgi:ABC-type uncharacterized transport system permease subunit
MHKSFNKWRYIFIYSVILARTSQLANAVVHIKTFCNIFAISFIWLSTTGSAQLLTYVLLGRLYFGLLDNNIAYTFSFDVLRGNITSKLLMPQNNFCVNLVTKFGERTIKNVSLMIVNLLVILFYNYFIVKIDFHLNFQLLLIILLLPFSYFIRHTWAYISGCLVFFIQNPKDNDAFQLSISTILTYLVGTIIPIYKIPNGGFPEYLPTAFLLHHPTQIYLGLYDSNKIYLVFVGAVFWCFCLWLIARLVYKKGLRKQESIGL